MHLPIPQVLEAQVSSVPLKRGLDADAGDEDDDASYDNHDGSHDDVSDDNQDHNHDDDDDNNIDGDDDDSDHEDDPCNDDDGDGGDDGDDGDDDCGDDDDCDDDDDPDSDRRRSAPSSWIPPRGGASTTRWASAGSASPSHRSGRARVLWCRRS